MRFTPALLVILFSCAGAAVSRAADFEYIRQGSPQDVQTRAEAGVAMMGGGSDLDEAFRWLCGKAAGGDFLILRARGDADYNSYVNGLCKANSVATLIIPSRKAAQEPRVAEIIGQAEAIFIAGGDQSRYVNFWKGTPVQNAINAHVAARASPSAEPARVWRCWDNLSTAAWKISRMTPISRRVEFSLTLMSSA
jgi:cyanophycinase